MNKLCRSIITKIINYFQFSKFYFFCWKKYFKTSVSVQYAQNRITIYTNLFLNDNKVVGKCYFCGNNEVTVTTLHF